MVGARRLLWESNQDRGYKELTNIAMSSITDGEYRGWRRKCMIGSNKLHSGFNENFSSEGRQADLHGMGQLYAGVHFSLLHSVCMPLIYSVRGIGISFHFISSCTY